MTAEELFTRYLDKHKENIRRQDEGYDHTMRHKGFILGNNVIKLPDVVRLEDELV